MSWYLMSRDKLVRISFITAVLLVSALLLANVFYSN